MLGFWIVAAIVSAAAGAVMLAFARRAARAGGGGDPTVAAYERQLQEVDDLARRGLLAQEERDAARSEAARRLLQAARRSRAAAGAAGRGRWVVPAAAAGAPLLAMVLYLSIGRPDAPDQPHRERVARWRAAPEQLGPAEAAAVLETVVRERPRDAQAYGLLGRARLAAGDSLGALQALEQAARLEPRRADRWTDVAQAMLSLETPDTAGARRALARAVAIDPKDVNARYWNGRVELAEGGTDAAIARWRALAADLPAQSRERLALEAEIEAVRRPAAVAGPDIGAMVEGLAARLREQPDDPAGWARLARAYAVLGREDDLRRTLGEARRLFAARPEALARIEAEAEAGRRVQGGR